MKFSIVITTYNRLPLLRRAVESALAQTWPCEVVVADDCSDDGTQEYISSLGDRVVSPRNSVNLGHSATLNAGVSAARGQWIKPLDDDDYLAPNCIEEMSRAIAKRPQAVLCSCQAIQVDDSGSEITRTQSSGPGKSFYVPQEDIHYGMLMEVVPFGTPVQVAFQKDAFIKSGGWDSALDTNCDDIDSWVRIAQYGDAVFLNDYLAYRTLWPGGYNKNFSLQKRLDTSILIKDRIYKLVSENHRSSLPALEDIHGYLKLHWSVVSLKQRKPATALAMAYPAMFSLTAWKYLAIAVFSRKVNHKAHCIRQEVIEQEMVLIAPKTPALAKC